ncbi:MAG: LCP family protein [Actinomycetaceae bacterium]|nr:LCP family protein [Actinomycetaceae bacterium]MDY6083615.1 LCP family protein [Actinomycetaceae bacterium]
MKNVSPLGAHYAKPPAPRRGLRALLLALLSLALIVASTAYFGVMRLQGNIQSSNVGDLLGRTTPDIVDPNAGRPVNILVLGSDVRRNADGSVVNNATVGGMRADTTMIVHISSDRSRMIVASIPRDLLVDIPSCTVRQSATSTQTFTTKPQHRQMFNAAFATGAQTSDIPSAAACTMKTVESITQIHLDGYAVLEFNSFKTVVDSLNGVPMYFDHPVNDPSSNLNVPQGCILLNGTQALALARARHNIGDGSDVSRISRQQQLVRSLVNEVLSKSLLTNVPSLYKVLDSATRSLNISDNLSGLSTMAGLAQSLKNITGSQLATVTAPFEADPYDPNRLVLAPNARELWNAIINDQAIIVTGGDTNGYGERVQIAPSTSQQSATSTDGQHPAQSGASASGDQAQSSQSQGAQQGSNGARAQSSPSSPSASHTKPPAVQATVTCTRQSARSV